MFLMFLNQMPCFQIWDSGASVFLMSWMLFNVFNVFKSIKNIKDIENIKNKTPYGYLYSSWFWIIKKNQNIKNKSFLVD